MSTHRPFFGCLTDAGGPRSPGVSYTYRLRGTRAPLFPDLTPEVGGASGEIPLDRGSLRAGAGGVAWSGAALLDFGVDVVLRFGVQVHAAELVFERGSGLAGIEVFRADGDPETFVPVGRLDACGDGRLRVPLGVLARALVVRLHACYRTITLQGLEVWGAVLDGPVLYPVPEILEMLPGGPLSLSALKAIVVEEPASAEALFAARLLADKLREEWRAELPLGRGQGCAIRFVLDGDRGKPERYSLECGPFGVVIRASGRRGLVYGAESLLCLLRGAGPARSIAFCRIDDGPAMEVRGVHMGLPPREEIPFLKRLVRSLLVPMRYNTVFLEFAGGMELERRPEINRAWVEANERAERGEAPPLPHGSMVAGGRCLSKAEVRDLVDSMREYGIEVIPEVQSLSHVQYLTVTYPHIAETEPPRRRGGGEDAEKADALPPERYPHCYCPSLEESYAIVFDLIDEIVEVVRPERYVHMGHDEVYSIGVCERCRGKDPAELFADHVLRVREHLRSKGLGTMIWSDMLQEVTSYRTPPAIARIPRDVVMLDFIWYFHLDKEIEDHLLDAGFRLIMGNMYSSHYPRFSARRRKAGVVGAEVSTWLRVDEHTLATEGKLYDFLYSSAMLWWAGYREELRRSLDYVLAGMIPALRDLVGGRRSPSRSPRSSSSCIPVPDAPLVLCSPRAAGTRRPSSSIVPVGARFDSLVFLHAATANAPRVPWKPLTRIAEYVVRYADGAEARLPVEFGGSLAPLGRAHALPMASPIYRHQGYIGTWLADPVLGLKDGRGEDRCLYAWEWLNPRPGEPVREIDVRACDIESDCALELHAITGVRLEDGAA
jgi:hypothetical protein